MRVTRVDHADPGVRGEFHELLAAASQVDLPGEPAAPAALSARWITPTDEAGVLTWFACGGDGRLLGAAWLELPRYELLDAFGRVLGGMNDAPQGDLDWKPVTVDGPRIRAQEEATVRRGSRRHVLCVRERATGVLAGYTAVFVATDTSRAAQGGTTVLAPFRGRGLGWIKAAMLVRLAAEEPHVTRYDTFNAAENQHMIAINRRLGYPPGRHVAGPGGPVALSGEPPRTPEPEIVRRKGPSGPSPFGLQRCSTGNSLSQPVMPVTALPYHHHGTDEPPGSDGPG
jgi:RimJ/RimL family protein N-acetyltransferase